MADDKERVSPVMPASGGRTYRLQPFGAEERPPRPPRSQKRPLRQEAQNQCTITAEKVDCKI